MFKEEIKLRGTPTFKLYDSDGQLKYSFTKNNLIVDTGNAWIVSRLAGSGNAVMSHIGVGSSTDIPASANTTLGTQVVRVAMTVAGGTVAGAIITYNATLGPGVGTGTLSEAGVFNASTAGTMLSRVSFTPFTKAAGDTLVIEWVFSQV